MDLNRIMTDINTLVAEDDEDLRALLLEFLELSGINARGTASVKEFMAAYQEAPCDVAIVDLGLPDGCGHTIVSQLSGATNKPGIIVLSARCSNPDRVAAYENGADIFIQKPASPKELVFAIRNLHGRVNVAPEPQHSPIDRWVFDDEHATLTGPNNAHCKLTTKELRLIRTLSQHSDNGGETTRDEILQALSYPDDEYGNRALESLIRRLRKKIKEETALESPIVTVHGLGYKLNC